MLKILVVGARGIPDVEGGAEKNAENLFPRLTQLGCDVTLIGFSGFIDSPSYRGVKLVRVPKIKVLKTEKLFGYIFALLKAVRLKPDIVHLQGLGSALFLFAYKLLGFKVVVRYGSADYMLPKWGLLGKLGFLFAEYQLRYADAVISVTPALSARLAERGIKRNVHLVANALDDIDGRRADSIKPLLVAVGRVTSQKNVHTLIRAFNILRMKYPQYRLEIIGGLDDTDYVSSLQPDLNNAIGLVGKLSREEIFQRLFSCALYLNLSIHEGMSNASLEAISAETPILLSDIPENRDLPLPDHNFVDISDSNNIAQKIATVLEEPSRYIADRKRFSNWDDISSATLNIYRAISFKDERLDSYAENQA